MSNYEVIERENYAVSRRPRQRYVKRTLFEGNGRKLLWDGLGIDVSQANSAMEVCKLAELDYEVKTEPIFTGDGVQIKNIAIMGTDA